MSFPSISWIACSFLFGAFNRQVKLLEEGARRGSVSPREEHQAEEAKEASQQVAALTSRVNALEKREAR